MTEKGSGDGELFIHLDLAGLAALLRAVEAAMASGRGQLSLPDGSGMSVGGAGAAGTFGKVTVTFADPAGPSDDDRRSRRPDPDPIPRVPVLELQD